MTALEAVRHARTAILAAMKDETDNIVRTHLLDAATAVERARDRIVAHQWRDDRPWSLDPSIPPAR